MALFLRMNNRNRMVVCVLFAFLSLLLIGAGRVTTELQHMEVSRQNEQKQWTEQLDSMLKEIPIEHQSEWRKTVKENPSFLLKVNTIDFRMVAVNEFPN